MPPTAPEELIDAGTPATPTAAAELIEAGTPATPGAAATLVEIVRDAGSVLTITGTLNDGTAPVSFPPLPAIQEIAGRAAWGTGDYLMRWFDNLPPSGGWGLNSADGAWTASGGASPELATGWAPVSPSTGTPVLTRSGGTAAAELIESGTPASPDAPGELI